MRRTILFALALALPLVACGDKDDDSGSAGSDSGSTDDGSTDDGSTDGGSTDGGTAGSDAAFHATGTYDGDSFEVDCAFDGTDPDWTATLQCYDGIQIFAACRLDPDDAPVGGLAPDQFQVWFKVTAAANTVGTHDVTGTDSIAVGNNLGAPLGTNSQNIEAASITIDSIDGWTAASGTFTAEWNDSGDEWAGDHTATITGSFDLVCPEG
ncbi:MAG: hypothetical protein H6742_10235 [Alphaproteobacteria bacterium]|nr:hypothetical protein [Alphaproteobacteria bacterium]